ncbi:MAG: SDR family NAD(P)-dependent oxidoreductase, partial [Candidatus Eremiobacteraeota bacterium]|nr:SDR family NAD(P)-dependent oxidoreductase [Candidatus Eremiobacteraeota bacterium]
MTSLAGHHAVVTGGAKGIGRAIADALARRGAKVSVMSRTASRQALPYLAIDVDVTDEEAIEAAFG